MSTPDEQSDLYAELELLRRRVAALERIAEGQFGTMLLHTLVRNMPNGFVFVFDHDLRYIFSEAGGGLREGMQRGVTEGRSLAETTTPEEFARLEPIYRATLAGQSTQFTLPAFGGLFDMRYRPVRTPAGEVLAGMIIATDVTNTQTAESRLRLFEQLVERAPDGITVIDLKGRITYTNQASAQLHGLSRAAMLGMSVVKLTAPEDHEFLANVVGTALQSEGQWFGRMWAMRPDGTRWRQQISAMAIRDADGQHVANASIHRDVTGEEEVERERAALQEQIIAAQQAAIRELSTPLIPLARGVIVMPLVGTIDTRRAQQVLETLLEGITAYQARTAIMDITGVRVVDTQVANALLRAAQASRLLGAEVVLTGINAEVAQTIVQLGVTMEQIVTRSNLQAGIAYALK